MTQPILDAIEAAVKSDLAGSEQPSGPIRAAYITEAQQMLDSGASEEYVISQFNQIAKQNQ
jgi:hypothetical protein